MLRFLHTAGLHLGAAFEQLPAEKAAKAQTYQFHALEHLVRVASREEVDCILIAGDLFHTASPDPTLFSRAMSVLEQAPCPVFLSPGQHDFIHAQSPYETCTLPKNLHVFTGSSLESVHLNQDTAVWGAALQEQAVSVPLAHETFSQPINLCVLHSDLHIRTGCNHYTADTLAKSGFSYFAAGGSPIATSLQRTGSTIFCSSGGLAALSEQEVGAKGFLLIQIGDTVKAQFIESKAMQFAHIEIDLTPIPSDVGLQKVLIDRIPKKPDHVCASVVLTGERVYEPNIVALRRVLDQVFLSCTVSNETIPKKPLWRYLQQDDIRGTVSRRYRDLIEAAPSSEEKDDLTRALRFALAAFDEDPMPPLS